MKTSVKTLIFATLLVAQSMTQTPGTTLDDVRNAYLIKKTDNTVHLNRTLVATSDYKVEIFDHNSIKSSSTSSHYLTDATLYNSSPIFSSYLAYLYKPYAKTDLLIMADGKPGNIADFQDQSAETYKINSCVANSKTPNSYFFVHQTPTYHRKSVDLTVYRTQDSSEDTISNDILSGQVTLAAIPPFPTYSNDNAFLTASINNGQLKIHAFVNIVPPNEKLSDIVQNIGTQALDEFSKIDTDTTMSMFSRIEEGKAMFDLLIPGSAKWGVTHLKFEVTGAEDNFVIQNVTQEKYDFSNLEAYECSLTVDYIVCGGYNSMNFPYAYTNKVDTWLHIIRRKDGALKGDGKTITKFPLNDNVYPNILPKNQFTVQNYEDNIISYIEPSTRKIVTCDIFAIEDKENAKFWTFLLFGSFIIISFLVFSVLLGRKYGNETDWDTVRAKLGLDPVGGITLAQKEEVEDRGTDATGLTKGLTTGDTFNEKDGKADLDGDDYEALG